MSPHFLTRWVSRLIRNGSGILGFFPCWCLSPFPSPSISRCFSVHSTSLAIEFHSCFFFTTDLSPPIGRPVTYSLLGEFPGLGLALVPDVVVPEAEHGCAICAWSRNLVSNFCPGRVWTADLAVWWPRTLPLCYGAPPCLQSWYWHELWARNVYFCFALRQPFIAKSCKAWKCNKIVKHTNMHRRRRRAARRSSNIGGGGAHKLTAARRGKLRALLQWPS